MVLNQRLEVCWVVVTEISKRRVMASRLNESFASGSASLPLNRRTQRFDHEITSDDRDLFNRFNCSLRGNTTRSEHCLHGKQVAWNSRVLHRRVRASFKLLHVNTFDCQRNLDDDGDARADQSHGVLGAVGGRNGVWRRVACGSHETVNTCLVTVCFFFELLHVDNGRNYEPPDNTAEIEIVMACLRSFFATGPCSTLPLACHHVFVAGKLVQLRNPKNFVGGSFICDTLQSKCDWSGGLGSYTEQPTKVLTAKTTCLATVAL